mgnify:CR=1 FL=1
MSEKEKLCVFVCSQLLSVKNIWHEKNFKTGTIKKVRKGL